MACAPDETTRVTPRELAILSDTCIEAKELARYQNRTVVWLEQVRLGALPWRYDGKLRPDEQAEEAAIKKNERYPPVREAMLKELRARAKDEAKRVWRNGRALMFDWCDQVLLYKAHRVRIMRLHEAERGQAVQQLIAASLDSDPTKLASLETETAVAEAIRKADAKDRQVAGLVLRLRALGIASPGRLLETRPMVTVRFNRYAAQPVACLEGYRRRAEEFWRLLYDAVPELSLLPPDLVRRVVLTSEVQSSVAREQVWQTRRGARTDGLYVPRAA